MSTLLTIGIIIIIIDASLNNLVIIYNMEPKFPVHLVFAFKMSLIASVFHVLQTFD
jgi:hypothetical protein